MEMHTLKRIAFSICLLLFVGHEPASALTAGELLAQCEQLERTWVISGTDVQITRPNFDAGQCWGFLSAYFELAYVKLSNTENPTAPPTNPLHTCPPKGISFTQMVRMFLQEARNNAGALHQNASLMIWNMLARSFPCD
jgi:Rap1a immunity proteins